MNVIFVLWGTKYNSSQLEKLYNDVKQYRPNYNYYCFTDQSIDIYGLNIIPIPADLYLSGVWNKLYMFNKEFPISGKTWYFDIDTVIQSDPFKVDVDWKKINLLYSHFKDDDLLRLTNYDVKINSSVLAWNSDNSEFHTLWEHFQESGYRDYFMRKYAGIDRYIIHENFKDYLAFFPNDYTRSYKYENEKDAPVITFEELDFGHIDFEQELKVN